MNNEEKKGLNKGTKIFLAVCIIWALYCLTGIKNNLSDLKSEAELINRQLTQIDRSIRSH